jgi:Na+-translocating ferredoxin:NAD+ oxidoreductase RnfD subunit
MRKPMFFHQVLQFSHQWVDIVILVDGVRMLANVIIDDLIHLSKFVSNAVLFHGLSQ